MAKKYLTRNARINKYKPKKTELREWLRLIKCKAIDNVLLLDNEDETKEDIKFDLSDITVIYFNIKEERSSFSPLYALKLRSTGKCYDVNIKDNGVYIIELPYDDLNEQFRKEYQELITDRDFLFDFFADRYLPNDYMNLFPNHLDWIKWMKEEQYTSYFYVVPDRFNTLGRLHYDDIMFFIEEYNTSKLYAVAGNKIYLLDNMRFEDGTGYDTRIQIVGRECNFSYGDFTESHRNDLLYYFPIDDTTLSNDPLNDN